MSRRTKTIDVADRSMRGTIYAKNMREGVVYIGNTSGHHFKLHKGRVYCRTHLDDTFICQPSPFSVFRPTELEF